MANRKPVVIDGNVTQVPAQAKLADILSDDVQFVQQPDGTLVSRERFAQVPVPAGFETHLTPVNKGTDHGRGERVSR